MNGYRIEGPVDEETAARMIESGKWSAYLSGETLYLLPLAWDARVCYGVKG